jgi:multicomponent Na+:H+ antiporter subunit G
VIYVVILLTLSGLFFLLVTTVGLLRLPDFFTRVHAIGKADTLGSMLLLAGLAVYNGLNVVSLKLLLILFFVLVANPAAAHALTRAGLRIGMVPLMRAGGGEPDDDAGWAPLSSGALLDRLPEPPSSESEPGS